MSLLKELNESHITLKSYSLNAFLLPFWYLAIYLFDKDFYAKGEIIDIVMCINLSLISSTIFSYLGSDLNSGKSDNTFISNMTVSIILLCIWISILILIFYSLKYFFDIKINFYYFIILYFVPIFFLYLTLVLTKKPKKKKRE